MRRAADGGDPAMPAETRIGKTVLRLVTGDIAEQDTDAVVTAERFRRIAGMWFFPGILGLGLLIPYVKPMLRPPDWKHFEDRWSEGVCLQTSESSCGPACAATLLRRGGKTATEEQIARASFWGSQLACTWFGRDSGRSTPGQTW